MTLFLAILVLAAAAPAPAPPRPEQARFRYPEQTEGDMRAWLEVDVANRLHVQGLAGVTLTTCVEGGPRLEVQPVQLSDSSGSWKVQGRWSAWTAGEQQTSVCEAIELAQDRPGPTSLPAVIVRFRADATQPWSKAEWSSPLGEERDVPPPEMQEYPPSPWLRLLAAAAGVAVAGLLALAVWRRARRRPLVTPLSPEEKALRELAALRRGPAPPAEEWAVQHTRLSDVLRRYLAERLGIAALEQSSAELLTAICQRLGPDGPVPDQLRRFLDSCDRAKFAPRAGSLEDFQQALDLAQSIIEQVGVVARQTGPGSIPPQAPQG